MSQCTIINAHITDQVIQLSNLPRIASGSKKALQIRCTFCGKWAGCGTTAVFYRTEAEVYHVPVVEGLVTVPWEVLVDEGYFWLGFMGQDDLTRTTEAIRVEVAKGVLTVATATPQEPTPDIYQQIVAGYGQLEARFNEAIAMRTTGGGTDVTIAGLLKANEDDEGVSVWGQFISNGATAYVTMHLQEGLRIAPLGYAHSTHFILPGLAPMRTVELEVSVGTIYPVKVFIDPVLDDEGCARLRVVNTSENTTVFTAAELEASAEYSLASISIPELADIRAGYNGENYDVAGESVRATQEQVIELTNTANDLTANVDDTMRRVETLENGGLEIKDELITGHIKSWLDEHPEATTTVQDHSLTADKLVVGTLGYITPEMFGAKGDGETDDTDAINAALACGGTIIFDRKTYLVNADRRLSVKSNSNITLPVGCTIKAKTTSKSDYRVFNIAPYEDANETVFPENVKISGGGRIVGDLETHVGTSGQAGHGIGIKGANNVIIDGIEIAQCWGDGVYVQAAADVFDDGAGTHSKNVLVQNCEIHHVRRAGIAVNGGDNVKSINNVIHHVGGAENSPQCGHDFEGVGDYPNDGCEVRNTRCYDNVNGGAMITVNNTTVTVVNSELDALQIAGRMDGLSIDGCSIAYLRLLTITDLEKVVVRGCKIGHTEIYLQCPDVEFHKCDFVPFGDEEMRVRFQADAADKNLPTRLYNVTFEGCYFRTLDSSVKNDFCMLYFYREPQNSLTLTNCVFEVNNPIGLTAKAQNAVVLTNNRIKQTHARASGGGQALINVQTLQGENSVIVFANNTLDMNGVTNYYYKTQEAMRLYAATVYMVGNLIESTDVADAHGTGLSAVLCKMAGTHNTKKAVVANNTIAGSYSTYFTYPTTEGFVVKESNNLLLCKE